MAVALVRGICGPLGTLSSLIYESSRYFPPGFESTGLLVQQKRFKIEIQDSSHGGHLGFHQEDFSAIFDPQVVPKLPQFIPSLESTGISVQ